MYDEFFDFGESEDTGGCEKCNGKHAEDIYYHEDEDLYVRIGTPNIRDEDLHNIFIEVSAGKKGVGTSVDVNYCPFCGANLKERLNYVKHREW